MKHDQRRAAALLCSAATDPGGSTERLTQALDDPAPVVRHAAAIEMARLCPERLPESAVREMLTTLARLEYFERPTVAAEYEEVTATEDDSRDLGQEIALAFGRLRCGQADFVIPRLLEFWSFDPSFYELAFAMLTLVFPQATALLQPASLSGVQRRILQALVAGEAIWSYCGGFDEALAKRGLPSDREGMDRFLR